MARAYVRIAILECSPAYNKPFFAREIVDAVRENLGKELSARTISKGLKELYEMKFYGRQPAVPWSPIFLYWRTARKIETHRTMSKEE